MMFVWIRLRNLVSVRQVRLTGLALAVSFMAHLLAPANVMAADDSPQALYQGGMSRFVSGDYESSITYLEELVKIFGREPELKEQVELAMYARACALYNLGRHADAVKAFEEYIAQFPESKFVDEGMFRVGSSQQILEAYDLAIAAYQKLTARFPRSSYAEDALYQIGVCRLLQEQNALAAAAFQDFMRLHPNSPLWGQAGAFCARAIFDDIKPAESIRVLEIIEKKPRTWSVITYCNFLAFEIGDYLMDDTDYELALKAYRRVKPRAALLRHQRSHVAALEARLAAMSKTRPSMHNIRSVFQEERRLAADLAQAREMAEKLENLPDYDANLFHRIGRCFFNTDRYWEARVAFTRVVATAAEDSVREAGHFDLILALSRLRRLDDLLIEADVYLATYDPPGKWE